MWPLPLDASLVGKKRGKFDLLYRLLFLRLLRIHVRNVPFRAACFRKVARRWLEWYFGAHEVLLAVACLFMGNVLPLRQLEVLMHADARS